jgi:hypothetical protein
MGNLLPTRRVIRMALLALAPGEQIPNYLLMIDKRDRQTIFDEQCSTNKVCGTERSRSRAAGNSAKFLTDFGPVEQDRTDPSLLFHAADSLAALPLVCL